MKRVDSSVMRRGTPRSLLAIVLSLAGCGDRTALIATSAVWVSDASPDARPDVSLSVPADASIDGGVPCGDMECVPAAVCVTTLTGAGACNLFPNDAGVCPGTMGQRGGCCYPATRECMSAPTSCVTGATCACPALCPRQCACYYPLSPEFLCDCTET